MTLYYTVMDLAGERWGSCSPLSPDSICCCMDMGSVGWQCTCADQPASSSD